MRREPTWRIPIGILGLVLILGLYALLVATASGMIGRLPVVLQTVTYVVLGTIWLMPLKRFLIWMETGRWTAPPAE